MFRGCVLWLLLCVPTALWGQSLTVLPSAGKAAGFVSAPEPGKWIVFATGFMPVQPTLVDGGKSIVFEGEAGEYAVIYLPPGDAQPLVQKVVLGGVAPQPDPPVPPGERWAVVFEESKQRTPEQAAIRTALKKSDLRIYWIDETNLPESWKKWHAKLPANQTLPALLVAQGDRMVRVVGLPQSAAAVEQEVRK